MKIAFPTDEHRPFHDEKAVELAQKIVNDFDPDILVVGSDGMDFYNISRFDKNPARIKSGLQDEIDSWKAGQREWRDAAPNAVRIHIRGNHEDRLRKYLWQHPELFGIRALELPNLLGFEELGIQDAGEVNEVNVNNLLVVRHGEIVKSHSAMSAKAELEREYHAISTLTGHTHRGGSYYVAGRMGVAQAHEGFCLCRLDPEYMDRPNWQQGIVLAEVTGIVTVEPVPFFNIRHRKVARWRGKEYVV